MKIELRIANDAFISSSLLFAWPSSINGYRYLVPCEGGYELWEHSYGDSHPWKSYASSDRLVDRVSTKTGDDLITMVARWNAAASAAQADADRKAEAERVQAWLDTLPPVVAGFKRDGLDLLDSCENQMFSLDSPQFRFKTLTEIESEITALFEDGFDPGA